MQSEADFRQQSFIKFVEKDEEKAFHQKQTATMLLPYNLWMKMNLIGQSSKQLLRHSTSEYNHNNGHISIDCFA